MTMMMAEEEKFLAVIRGYNSQEIFGKLAELSIPHLEKNKELFAPLAYDPELPFHDMTVVTLPPVPDETGIEGVKALFDIAYPGWRESILPAFKARTDLINELVNRFKIDKSPVSIILAHERIEDVAFMQAVLVIILSEFIPYEELIQRFHIVVSSMLRTVSAFGIPVPVVLQKIGWVHFSFPRTDSTRKGGFDEELVSASNGLMQLHLGSAPAPFKVVAAPGSIDKVMGLPDFMVRLLPDAWSDRHYTLHIQPVGRGTANMVKGYVLPVSCVLSGDKQFCEVGQLTWCGGIEAVHELMEWIADTRYARTLVPTFYHRERKSLNRLSRFLGR